MATDNSPPRLKLIITIGVITVVTLVGLNFILSSYYAYMSDVARHEKLAPPTGLEEHRRTEEAELASAKMPIAKAAEELAKGRREGLIAPQQSDDVGAMTGWSKLPKQAPEAAPAVAEDAGATTGEAATDAGEATAASTDAGASTTQAAQDAGAHAHDAGAKAPAPAAHDAGAHPAHP